MLDFQQGLEQKYGPLAGKPIGLAEARTALPADTVLVGWVDTRLHHAACVLHRFGDPAWVTIPGSGRDGEWTKDDEGSARRLRDAVASKVSAADWRPRAEAMAKQRLGPIESHLKAARHVIVLNSPGIAGVPVERLLTAWGKTAKPAPVVAYAPSASMFAYLAAAKLPADGPASLLALGDPAYPKAKASQEKGPPPPDHGLLVVKVQTNANADLSGVKAGDILLEYNGASLKARDDLKVVAAVGGPRQVALRLWRAGEVRSVEIAAGPLGAQLDSRLAAPVVLAQAPQPKSLPRRGPRPGSAFPEPAARSPQSPVFSPPTTLPSSWVTRRASQLCRKWPAPAGSRAFAISTSQPMGVTTPDRHTARR